MNAITALRLLGHVPKPVRKVLVGRINSFRTHRLQRRFFPQWITLFITNYCNARCQHCFYWQELNSKVKELTIGEFERIFSSFEAPLRTIRLSGGEPFLRKDLPDFYLLLDRLQKTTKLSVPTHGMLEVLAPIERMLSGSRNRTTLNVSVSLDGLEETHNAFRGIRGGFQRAIENLRRMVELDRKFPLFEVSVSTTVTRHNLEELPELIRFIKEDVGVKRYGFDHVRSSQTDVFDIDPLILADFHPPATEEDEADQAKKFLRTEDLPEDPAMFDAAQTGEVNEQLRRWVGRGNGLGDRVTFLRLELERQVKAERRRVIPCLAGRVDCVIYPNGDVSVCEFTKPFGNLRNFDFDFPRLWRSSDANAMREKTTQCACTHPCHLSDSLAYDTTSLLKLTEG